MLCPICQQTFVGQVGEKDEVIVYLGAHTLPEKQMCNVSQILSNINVMVYMLGC